MDIFEVNEDTCTQCGACIEVCHLGVIDSLEGGYPKPFAETEQMCSRCGACLVVCPTDSFIHRDITLEQCPSIDASLSLSYEQCAQLIKSRRSIRVFKDTHVPREDIERCIDAARYAPTGMNLQNIQWLVIDNTETIERFRAAGIEFMKPTIASPMFAALKDIWEKRIEANIDDFMHNAPAIVAIYSHKDALGGGINTTLALAYFDLAANSFGLGCCWNGFFTAAANNYPPIKEAIALPEDHVIHSSMVVGYPKNKHYRIPQRNPANITWK